MATGISVTVSVTDVEPVKKILTAARELLALSEGDEWNMGGQTLGALQDLRDAFSELEG